MSLQHVERYSGVIEKLGLEDGARTRLFEYLRDLPDGGDEESVSRLMRVLELASVNAKEEMDYLDYTAKIPEMFEENKKEIIELIKEMQSKKESERLESLRDLLK